MKSIGRIALAAGLTLGLLATASLPASASPAGDDLVATSELTDSSQGFAPPADDPEAVEEYLALLAEYRANPPAEDVAARAAGEARAAGPCLERAALVVTDPRGSIIAVTRKSGASFTLCTNAAQAVYDNEYKSMVHPSYTGNKWRDQLVCHIANAWNKVPWNLDSWRPDVGYPATVAQACNPN